MTWQFITYPWFLFFAYSRSCSVGVWFEKPNYRVSTHLSIAFLNSKMWILLLLLVHASKNKVGWNTIDWMSALLLPRFSSYTTSPASVLNILMMWPLLLALARRVPSGLTAMAPISVSCAGIKRSMLLSTTTQKERKLK